MWADCLAWFSVVFVVLERAQHGAGWEVGPEYHRNLRCFSHPGPQLSSMGLATKDAKMRPQRSNFEHLLALALEVAKMRPQRCNLNIF